MTVLWLKTRERRKWQKFEHCAASAGLLVGVSDGSMIPGMSQLGTFTSPCETISDDLSTLLRWNEMAFGRSAHSALM
jgi:hypothetical protein